MGLLLLFAGVGRAATTFTVTKTTDSDDGACIVSLCSVRDGVKYSAAGDTVIVPSNVSHYTVTMGELPISHALTIQGAGASSSVIDAQGSSRVFKITGVPSTSTVTFQGLTVTGGSTTGLPGGGGIDAEGGSVALVNAAVDGNSVNLAAGATNSVGGGGIYNDAGNVTLSGSSVSNNVATITTTSGCCQGGAGIYNNAGSTTVGSNSKLNNNTMSVLGPTADTGTACCDGGGAIYQDVNADTSISASTLSGNSVTVTGAACCHGGGAIYHDTRQNAVNISASTINNNTATVSGPAGNSTNQQTHCCSGGGAIAGFRGFTVANSTLNGNSATVTAGDCCHGGGALYPDSGSGMTVSGSTLSGNATTVNGAGCCHGGGAITTFSALTLTQSTLSGNGAAITSAECCHGGGAIQSDSGTGVVANATTISGNHANITGSTLSGGGGVYEDTGGATATNSYTNSTISGNTTNAANPQQGGGGIYMLNGSQALPDVLANTTIAGNTAPSGSGGGVLDAGAKVSYKNSIVALNTASSGGDCSAFVQGGHSPMFTTLGYNLEDAPDTCGFTGTGDKVVGVSSVKLAALANNGGPTQTRALQAGSPGIDGGNPAGCTNPFGSTIVTDQRGATRPDEAGTACDIGAYEFPSPLVAPSPTLSALRVSPHKVSIAGRKVKGRCVKPTKKNKGNKHCRRPVKLKISYTLNIAATVTVTLTRQGPGRKVKGRCVKPTKKNKKHKACKRLTGVPGKITRSSTAGGSSFIFNGKIGGRKLGPGTYRLTAAPSANGRVGPPQQVTFKVVG